LLDHDDSDSRLPDFDQLVEDDIDRSRREPCRRLVEQEHLWTCDEGTR